jgi:hypothetical protein
MQTDAKIAAYSIRCIRGCGQPESEAEVAALEPAIVKEIARYEREGRRHNIPLLLQDPPSPVAPIDDKPE